tara:strand:- start:41 stop:439 length:399 start_codon:yes stop_codon:yes gene_type:complete
MIFRFVKILFIFVPFIFSSGFLPIASLLGPGITIVSSGNVAKASAQFMIDRKIKQKTGKNSLTLVKDEVTKQSNKKMFNEELKIIIEKRFEITRKKLAEQNNQKIINKEIQQLVEKRIKISQAKLNLEKINQ